MKKAFDAVAWMRRRRTQIDEEEDRGLTWTQKRQKTHEEVLQDPVLGRLCSETVVPDKARPTGCRRAPLSSKRSPTRASRS
jgi:hypothetical protein